MQHFWSLAIEEQFYLFFPLLIAGPAAVGRGSRRVLGGVARWPSPLLSTLSPCLLYDPGTDTARVYYGTDTRAAELLVGAVFAVLIATRPDLLTRIPEPGR